MPRDPAPRWVLSWIPSALAFLAVLLFLFAISTRFTSASVSDEHGFRQSQTALTIRYLMRGGPFLRYETPVVGYPWSIPFEFPLYQGAVAVVARSLQLPLVPVARSISILSFVAVLTLGWLLLSRMDVPPDFRYLFLTPALISPIYLFWSRAVLIETFALALGLIYVYASLRHTSADRRSHRVIWFVVAALSGVLVALVKVTSFPPAAVAVILFLGGTILRHRRRQEPILPLIVALVALLVIPVICGGLWTRFADSVKTENPLGSQLTSSGLFEFNFGTPMNRLQSAVWGQIVFFNAWDILGGLPALFLPLFLFALPEARRRRQVAGCFLAYFVGPLLFTNLYRVHNYYACGSGIYLIAAFGFLIYGLLEAPLQPGKFPWRQWTGAGIVASALIFCPVTYFLRFYGVQKTQIPYYPGAVAILQKTCPENAVIVGYGLNWSSELAFYTDRRTVLSVYDNNGESPQMQAALDLLRREKIPVGGVILASDAYRLQKQTGSFTPQLTQLGMSSRPIYEDQTCAVYGVAR